MEEVSRARYGGGAQGSSLPSPVCHIPRSQGVGLKISLCFADIAILQIEGLQ